MKSSVSNRSIWNIACPIIFGNMAQTVISFTDTAFLGHIGGVELGASMMSGIYYFVFATLAWGFAVGVQIIIARRLGERRLGRIGIVFDHGLICVAFIAAAMFAVLHFGTGRMLGGVIESDSIRAAAMQYMGYRHYGIIFACFNFLFRSLYVGLSDTRPITYSTLLMAVVNITLDYGLIFGRLGLPQLGVGGAALASVCAEASALVFFAVFSVVRLPLAQYSLFRFSGFDSGLMREICRLSFPTMAQRLVSFGIWFAFFVMIEGMGEVPIAVSGLVRSVYMVITIPVFAFAATANTVTSRIIGEGRPDEVMPTLMRIMRNSLCLVVPLVAVCALIPHYTISIFTDDAELAAASVPVVYVLCAATLTMTFGMVFFEAVSGTGSTTAALWLETSVLAVYLTYMWLQTKVWCNAIHWVWTAEIVYGTLIGIISYVFVRRGTWRSRKV